MHRWIDHPEARSKLSPEVHKAVTRLEELPGLNPDYVGWTNVDDPHSVFSVNPTCIFTNADAAKSFGTRMAALCMGPLNHRLSGGHAYNVQPHGDTPGKFAVSIAIAQCGESQLNMLGRQCLRGSVNAIEKNANEIAELLKANGVETGDFKGFSLSKA